MTLITKCPNCKKFRIISFTSYIDKQGIEQIPPPIKNLYDNQEKLCKCNVSYWLGGKKYTFIQKKFKGFVFKGFKYFLIVLVLSFLIWRILKLLIYISKGGLS